MIIIKLIKNIRIYNAVWCRSLAHSEPILKYYCKLLQNVNFHKLLNKLPSSDSSSSKCFHFRSVQNKLTILSKKFLTQSCVFLPYKTSGQDFIELYRVENLEFCYRPLSVESSYANSLVFQNIRDVFLGSFVRVQVDSTYSLVEG